MKNPFKYLGEPIWNINIKLILDSVTFFDEGELDLISSILDGQLGIARLIQYGKCCEFAKKYLVGKRQITAKGYLLLGYKDERKNSPSSISIKHATLNINENEGALRYLEEVVSNRIRGQGMGSPKVLLRYADGNIDFVKAEKSYLYLPLVKEGIYSGEILSK
ncbi:MAG: hypothetical protein KKF52_02330 [Nanoarchaeota archaeon]|nr:hypothetical protein [Nanoarchaeota archaeon]MBU4352711.1 hypothetical protein [Nanoarchaeota archaeon]